MIYPDLAITYRKCPICNHELWFNPTQIAKIYKCPRNGIYLRGYSNGSIPHYEFLRYKDNSVATNFVIGEWWVMSDEEYSTINLIIKDQYGVCSISELGYRKSPLLLGADNLDKVKKKLNLLNLFY